MRHWTVIVKSTTSRFEMLFFGLYFTAILNNMFIHDLKESQTKERKTTTALCTYIYDFHIQIPFRTHLKIGLIFKNAH